METLYGIKCDLSLVDMFFCWTEILSSPQNEMIRGDSSSCFSHTHAHTHMQPLLMSWLCLLAVHSMIEMGVWVLSGRKSACQLAFSALFPISIKHPHHLLWAHSTTPCFSPESCTTDRWCALGTNHFSSHIEACRPPGSRSSFPWGEVWMGFGRLNWRIALWALTLGYECSVPYFDLLALFLFPIFFSVDLYSSTVNTCCCPITGKHPNRCRSCHSQDKGLLYAGELYFAL